MKRFAGLVFHLAAGIARDLTARRQVISALLLLVLAMFALGIFAFWDAFSVHPLIFALYWLACGGLTLGVALLAAYDLLMVLRQGREERLAARREIFGTDDDPHV